VTRFKFNLLSVAISLLIAAVMVYFCNYYLFSELKFITSHHEDDVFYYMKISNNFARGLWFTYDGTNPTNGFHPLWAALVAVVLKLFGSGAGAELYFPIQFLFFLLAIVGLFFILVRQSASLPLALMLALIVGLSPITTRFRSPAGDAAVSGGRDADGAAV
jgi:hypothetical protein